MKVGSILILLGILTALAVYFFLQKPDEPPPFTPEPRPLVWDVDMNELQHITINLPPQGKSEAFVQHTDRLWYFDEPDGPRVDRNRWGGGIPLILSGPEADRFIEKDATEERLAAFGFTPQPVMEIILTLHNDSIIDIEVGRTTLQGGARYVRLADSSKVYTVDASWHDVLARLVTEPPDPPPEEEE